MDLLYYMYGSMDGFIHYMEKPRGYPGQKPEGPHPRVFGL